MKIIFYFKNFKPGFGFKNFAEKKLSKLKRFFGQKEESVIKVEIEKTEEVEPKKGSFKTEIHYQPVGEQEVIISSQSKTLKDSFLKAFHKLKEDILKLHRKFYSNK